MATKVKQGDQYQLPVTIWSNDDLVDPDDIAEVEIMLGDTRYLYPGSVTYDAATKQFLVPMTQEQTFAFEAGSLIEVDIRVKFTGGDIIGARATRMLNIIDALSEEVL